MKNIVYFDLETQKSAQEVGGWGKIGEMLMSIGATYSTQTGRYKIYAESEVDAFIKELFRADLVVGFNHQRFDFTVLEHYTMLDFKQIPSLDLMLDIEKKIQHRISLDAIAEASCGINKTAEGLQALQWWKQGKVMQIAEYCCYDVKVTRLVHEYGAANGHIKFKSNKTQLLTEVPVEWSVG
jgi:DEAD/DEAH box helicase domain-containing protein